MTKLESDIRQLRDNVAAHDRVARKYERIHGEIYNEVEQLRLQTELRNAKALIDTGNHERVALDFGCGAGNLTRHLLELNFNVISADVSQNFLNLVQARYSKQGNLRTIRLNGVDLDGVPDESIDMVATYSVLHHVPDYLSILDEFVRVLRPGGVLYIDHESSENIWENDPSYTKFNESMRSRQRFDWQKYFYFNNYIDFLVRKFINPKYRREGDIHVFTEDHIEWELIRKRLPPRCEAVLTRKYLLFKRGYCVSTYADHCEKTFDMQLMVFKKNSD